ncbi:GntR family transcriptional regulator [Actinoplanes sp. ATCC 53533]|uniref:GntR family transcriptional regulator n=1 Tax=Actinoplanes sp. ATCC 53533 TaxID=1288362 RepID=UPI000F783E30|nr:GntR family transcriptional regulator [Actinoplanes sp. ATCC 53533]RSM50451.1 GntR family transcriptional regulator [Actinoplanes sp. ATCC 53533]
MSQTVNQASLTRDPVDGLRPSAEQPSMSERAYREIRDRLVMLDIRPGTPINDQHLALEFGIGRTPVREALKRLETERLVVAFPRRGTFATEVHLTDLAYLTEVRILLEPAAAAHAAIRARPAERRFLTSLADSVDELDAAAVPARELIRADLTIHRAVYDSTHNPHLRDTLVRYDNLATRIWCLMLDQIPAVATHVQQHGPLLRAIVAGDADGAASQAREHVAGFERQVRTLL